MISVMIGLKALRIAIVSIKLTLYKCNMIPECLETSIPAY